MPTTKNKNNIDSVGRNYVGITPEDFIRAWQKGDSVQSVADALGMTRQGVSARAINYRHRGIPLKEMRRCVKRLDLPALTKIAKNEGR